MNINDSHHYIIGTAGHIDHGKTSLIRALTGIETDRLKEEKERGITIDLGFAYFTGTDGRKYGIVDVPGHEKFIPNMLAGAHGFDVVVMVVAADDGVKPQTIEHFDILHLLRVPRALFVITKIDMVEPDRIEEVKEEIAILTHDSHLANSKIIPASSVTKQGLEEVRAEISRLMGERIEKIEHPYFRYPIDRAFTITGFGTVVTGTIINGNVKVDDELLMIPLNRRLRVRNIEVHEENVNEAYHGQRAAINLVKIEKSEIERGMELINPELVSEMNSRYYAKIEILPHSNCKLKNFSRVRLFKGTMEETVTLINIEGETFQPKGHYVAQVNFPSDYLITSGERFIVRDETNKFSIGGGEFLIPATIKRTRMDPHQISQLSRFDNDNLADKLETFLIFEKNIFVPMVKLSTMFNRSIDEITMALRSKSDKIAIIGERDSVVIYNERFESAKKKIVDTIDNFHKQNPEFPGIEKKKLRDVLRNDFQSEAEIEKIWISLVDSKRLFDGGEFLKRIDFQVKFSGVDADVKNKILDLYSDVGGNTPKKERLAELLNMDVEQASKIFQSLLKSKEIILITAGVYVSRSTLEDVEKQVVDFIMKNGEITVAQLRDLIATNRNMAVLFLEYLDTRGVTIRQGNQRTLRKK